MKKSTIATAFATALLAGCSRERTVDADRVRVGFVNGPLAGTLYVAEAQAARDGREPVFTGVPFNTSGDIGYALIAGEIDAGFIETAKATALLRSVNGLRAVGAVTFPYGATMRAARRRSHRSNSCW